VVGEPVLCGDETPVNVAHKDSDEHGTPVPGAPHVLTVRTPEERLVWYRAARTKVALRNLGVLGDYAGYLGGDDYAGWHQFDKQVAGVQQCVAHLFRHLQGVLDLLPDHQAWAARPATCCARPTRGVEAAKAARVEGLDPALLAEFRARYDKAVTWRQATNRHRDWPKGSHPGYALARRMADKADRVWLHDCVFPALDQ
jgi:hypothetical protein